MNSLMIALIVILILILAIIFFVYYLVYSIKRKASQFSREVFGTDSLTEGIGKMETEYATTPKSVSAMTSLYLPRITKDFPDFSYDEMKEKAQNTLTSYLLGIHSFDASKLVDGNTELHNKLAHAISIWQNKDQREHFDSIRLHRTEISGYTKKNGRCIITFQSSVQYYHYVTDRDGNIISGKKDVLFQAKYETDLIYIQDRAIAEHNMSSAVGLNCPNCGAPITNLGQKFCEYCGSGIIELNIHAWSFGDVREL